MVGLVPLVRAVLRAFMMVSAMVWGSVGTVLLVGGSFPRGMLWEPGSGRSWEGIVVVVVVAIFAFTLVGRVWT